MNRNSRNLPAKYEKPRGFLRDSESGKVAGVCAGLENGTGVPALAWRLGFLLTTFFWGVGIPIYAMLWFAMDKAPTRPPMLPPATPDEMSPEDREIFEAVRDDMQSLGLRNDK